MDLKEQLKRQIVANVIKDRCKTCAHIFFDDQRVHTDPASEVVASAVVPYREGDDPRTELPV